MQIGKQTGLILLDFSKAFDKVADEKILLKLHHYGIRRGKIKDFLDNRKQAAAVINGINSDKISISSGVPQGSVLGPILFLAYITRTGVHKQPVIALYFESETVLKFYNLGAWSSKSQKGQNP